MTVRHCGWGGCCDGLRDVHGFCFVSSAAAQKIMTAKKQAALLASCKSLPNSPTHSGGSTPVSGVFPGQVGPPQSFASTLSLLFSLDEVSLSWAGQ